VAVVSVLITGLQLAVFSSWRFAGVVVMLVWLWPVCLGLAGSGPQAITGGAVSGFLFDAHAQTHFGLTAVVGASIGYAVSRLGREGVGDLDSAALWVAPIIGAAAGFVTPVLYVVGGVVFLDFDLWRGSLLAMMVVNATAFFLLVRPLTRLARILAAYGQRAAR
jgi:rod shape-determining protein MreD